jgi:4-aminobutyrate aminotransferase-like enzyme
MAKSLAGGFPLSAVVGRAEVMDAPEPGGLGGTYAGNPLACAAALAVLESVERDEVLPKALRLGEQLKRHLGILAHQFPFIGEIRGIGAMLAFDLCEPRAGRSPAARLAREVIAEAARRGLLLLSCGPSGNTIRILVPLTAETEHIDRGISILRESLTIASRADPR